MKYTAMIDGERIDIEVNRGSGAIEAAIDGRKYALEAREVEPGVYWLNWKNRSLEIAVTPNGEGYVVTLAGRRVKVEMVDSRTALRRAAHRAHDGAVEIRAPMPGKIIKVLLAEGDEVQANQGILVMEAMKMQNEIKSPKKGKVQKLAVAEGAAVSSGDLLAAVE
jgi:biotin carboxyl carrier protein